jgi:large subunit ribosomal protein L23
MAIFGSKKSEKKDRGVAKRREAHAVKLAPGIAHDILRAPWLSEKALIGTERGVFVFAVATSATSAEIAGAINEIYGVAPRAVRIVNVKGKTKPLRSRRGTGQRASRRKAYVCLNAGDSISLV